MIQDLAERVSFYEGLFDEVSAAEGAGSGDIAQKRRMRCTIF